MTNIAHWLPVVDYEDLYEVSDQGDVRNLDGKILSKCKIHKNQTWSNYIVSLTRNGRSKNCKVAVLVLEAFVCARPKGQIPCHGPLGPLDDSLPNLVWGTYSKNNGEDRRRDGTLLLGETHPRAKLTEESVLEIRRLHEGKWPISNLARRFQVTETCISSIVKRRTWRHI